jgi:hypothetical protein
MLFILYSDLRMCATCGHLSLGTVKNKNVLDGYSRRILVCQNHEKRSLFFYTKWNSVCNCYTKYNRLNITDVINTSKNSKERKDKI